MSGALYAVAATSVTMPIVRSSTTDRTELNALPEVVDWMSEERLLLRLEVLDFFMLLLPLVDDFFFHAPMPRLTSFSMKRKATAPTEPTISTAVGSSNGSCAK